MARSVILQLNHVNNIKNNGTHSLRTDDNDEEATPYTNTRARNKQTLSYMKALLENNSSTTTKHADGESNISTTSSNSGLK